MADWTTMLAGGFAGDAAPFGVHPKDRERAVAYLEAAKAGGLSWADVEAQLVDYMRERGFADDAIDENLERAAELWRAAGETSPTFDLLSGGFAHMDAPFGLHPKDRERAQLYRTAAKRAGLRWADVEADVRAYARRQSWTEAKLIDELVRVRKFMAGHLGS